MEDQAKQPFQGPHCRALGGDASAELTPLRLVIEGGEVTLVVDRTDMIAGRHSDADLRLPLPDVSRRHCRFTWNAGRWQVIDLGSLNGIYVNDSLVQQATLAEGDRLSIGGFTFVVHLAAVPVAEEDRSLYNVFKMLPRPNEQPPRRLAS